MFLGGSELVKAAIDMSTAALGPLWRCGLCHFPLSISARRDDGGGDVALFPFTVVEVVDGQA
jgi:hypothetical protein